MQIDRVKDEEELRYVFDDENDTNNEDDQLVYETGFSKPLCLLTMDDREGLKKALRDYTMIKVKAELDQFCDGLKCLGVLDCIKKFPAMMNHFFCKCESKLSKG